MHGLQRRAGIGAELVAHRLAVGLVAAQGRRRAADGGLAAQQGGEGRLVGIGRRLEQGQGQGVVPGGRSTPTEDDSGGGEVLDRPGPQVPDRPVSGAGLGLARPAGGQRLEGGVSGRHHLARGLGAYRADRQVCEDERVDRRWRQAQSVAVTGPLDDLGGGLRAHP